MYAAFCTLVTDWDSLTPEERCGTVGRWLFEMAADWDIELSSVDCEDLPPGRLGAYDPATGSITLDSDLFGADGPWDALAYGAHELGHAFQDSVFDDAGLDILEGLTPAERDELDAWADWFALWTVDAELEACGGASPADSAPSDGALDGLLFWEYPPWSPADE